MSIEKLTAKELGQQKAALGIVAELGLKPLQQKNWSAAAKMLESKATPGYADTWTYLTQAANGHALRLSATGYLAKEAQSFCIVGLFSRPVSGDLAIHLINPVGSRAADLVQNLCGQIRKVSHCAIYLKKGDPDLIAELADTGDFGWNDDLSWHQQAPQEDDTFPELLLDVSRSLELFEAGRLHQARDKYARFLNRNRQREITWLPLVAKRYPEAREIIARFFNYKAEDHIDISKPCDYENMLTHSSLRWNADGLIRQLCCIDGKACAVLVMEQIGKSNAIGLYCNLAMYQEHKYLSEFIIHRALTVAKERGFRYMNLGGSESEGLHTFKSKFQPVDEAGRKWLVFSR